jgi:hypothetical protein
MHFSKLSAASGLFLSPFIMAQKGKHFNECASEKPEDSKEVQDLDKIFAQDGGMPPDPEEIQAIIAKMKGQQIR